MDSVNFRCCLHLLHGLCHLKLTLGDFPPAPPLSPSVWPGSPSLSACQPVSPPWTTTPRRSWWWDRGVTLASTPAASTSWGSYHLITLPRTRPSPWPAPHLLPGYPTCLPTTSPRWQRCRAPPLLRGSHTPAPCRCPTLTPSLPRSPTQPQHPPFTACPFPLRLHHPARLST